MIMQNKFELNKTSSELVSLCSQLDADISLQAMRAEILAIKSNALCKNKYLTSLNALKTFVEPN